MPTAYQMFVKEHMGKFKHLPPKERMKACAAEYRKMKGMPMKKGMAVKKGPVVKNVKGKKVVEQGGSILGSIIPFGNLLGLGLDTKKMPKKRAKKGGNMVTPTMNSSGGNFWDDFSDGANTALGLARHVLF